MQRDGSSGCWLAALFLMLLLLGTFGVARTWQHVQGMGLQAVANVATVAPVAPTFTRPALMTVAPTIPSTFTPLPATPTASITPSRTPSPTVTPTPTHTAAPTASPFATLEAKFVVTGTAVPTAVPPLAKPEGVTNIVLLGNDVSSRAGGRTDSIIIVSINEQTKTATMLSLPRDLYVVIPGWKMDRINTALPHGHGSGYPGGGGALIKDTILYNFGIPVDYYARIGFDGFKQVVDLLDGIDVAVSCSVYDWRLKSPELDPQSEENWEEFELTPGLYHMHGDLALWYVRSRRTSNDFERGRRQQQVLRAILDRAVEGGFVAQLPELWNAYQDNVETDMPLTVMAQLAAMAPQVRDNGIQHLFLPQAARRAYRTSAGAAVQLIRWEGAEAVFAQLMRPPVLNHATRSPITVEVVSYNDTLYWLAADNLIYHGFIPKRGQPRGETPNSTQVSYFGQNLKGSFDWLLSWIFNVDQEQIQLVDPGAGNGANYRIVLGYNYDPCRPQVEAPTLGRGE